MALQMNTCVNTSTEIHHHLKQLPFTIIPITEGALNRNNADISEKQSTLKPPDLTFHCMCCEEYFISPFLMYEHLNTKHADMPEPQEPEEELDDNKDYSWVFEPVCELLAPEEGEPKKFNGAVEGDVDEDSDSDDSDSDDDSSTSSSSSSSSSSSDSSNNTNSNTNTQDELTRDSLIVDKPISTMDDNTTMEVMEEGAYEEVEANSVQSQNSQNNSIQLKVADPRESTSIIFLNPPIAENGITPILAQPVRRGRGRRSAAQQAAIEMSSLICGEPKCFQCTHCEESFPSAGDLSKHVRCHITNKPFQCSICEKTFTHIGSLNTHIRIHSGEKPYKCELCSKAFTQSSSLMVHLRSHSIRKPHQCHLCDKGFVNSTSLVIHLKTHKSGCRYSCAECDKSFKHESQLKEHMRMHNQTLVYQCSICRNAFATSSELVQHMKCHMGEKPFTCSICDRSFTQSGSLNIHMRIHTGEKPFNCNLCNKSFTQASSLSVHMKIHSGEKPFPCHICGKSYSQAAYLSKHIQHHIEYQKQGLEPVFPVRKETLLCIVCGDLHSNANSLALHVTRKHSALLHNMKENHFKPGDILKEERFQQEEQYIKQMQLLMQLQQQIIKQPPQNPQKMQDMEEEEEMEDDEENLSLQTPQDKKRIINEINVKQELEENEPEAEYQQNLIPVCKRNKQNTEEKQEGIEDKEELYEDQRNINHRNKHISYDKLSEFEDDDGEADMNNIEMLNTNSIRTFTHRENNGFMSEIKDIEMSAYSFLEDAEYDDYDDYAAEEEVETEE